jgi:hypothetical protein
VGFVCTAMVGRTGILYSSPKIGYVDPIYVSVNYLSGNCGTSSSMTFPRESKRRKSGSRGVIDTYVVQGVGFSTVTKEPSGLSNGGVTTLLASD